MVLNRIRAGKIVHMLVSHNANGAVFLCGRWSSWGSFSEAKRPVTCKRCLQVAAETGEE